MAIYNKIVTYLVNSKNELRKVAWPTKRETANNTLLVIGVSLAIAIFLGGLDFFLNRLLESIV